MKTATALILSFTGFLLTACINLEPKPDNTRRFVLGPVAQTAEVSNESSDDALSVYVMPPHLPTYLGRQELLYRTAGGEVAIIPAARWAEPLIDGVARAFAHYLDRRSNIQVAGYYPWPQPSETHGLLSLRFSRFEATDGGLLQVAANWSLRMPDGSRREGMLRDGAIRWQVGDSESFVAAHNRALEALAVSLAEKLR